jgi:hypothetical protein
MHHHPSRDPHPGAFDDGPNDGQSRLEHDQEMEQYEGRCRFDLGGDPTETIVIGAGGGIMTLRIFLQTK